MKANHHISNAFICKSNTQTQTYNHKPFETHKPYQHKKQHLFFICSPFVNVCVCHLEIGTEKKTNKVRLVGCVFFPYSVVILVSVVSYMYLSFITLNITTVELLNSFSIGNFPLQCNAKSTRNAVRIHSKQ